MGKLLATRNGSPYPLVTRGKRTLSSERHEDCAALGGLAHEHGSDAEAHGDLDAEGDHFPFENSVELEFATKMIDK
jgi:hypothetical protein